MALCISSADNLKSSSADRGKHGDQAMAALREAAAQGFTDVDRLQKESAFIPLRSREDFKALLAELSQKKG